MQQSWKLFKIKYNYHVQIMQICSHFRHGVHLSGSVPAELWPVDVLLLVLLFLTSLVLLVASHFSTRASMARLEDA